MHLQLLLEPFRKVINEHGYNLENTVEVMQLNTRGTVDASLLKAGFKRLCSHLTEDKYNKITKIILQGAQRIEYETLQ